MVEITMEEPIQIEPVKRSILHGYEEEIFQEINVLFSRRDYSREDTGNITAF